MAVAAQTAVGAGRIRKARDYSGLTGQLVFYWDALKAVPKVKKWPAPKDTRLMDGGAINMPGPGGKTVSEMGFISPYAQPMVVANPTVPRAANPAAAGNATLDPFVVKLNASGSSMCLPCGPDPPVSGLPSCASPRRDES